MTSAFDIGEITGMLDVQGGKGWVRQYSRHIIWINDIIINLARKLMKNGLKEEISATIEIY